MAVKLQEAEKRSIIRMIEEGYSLSAISTATGVSRRTVGRIKKGLDG